MSTLEKREEEEVTQEGTPNLGETPSAVIEVILTNKPQPTRPLLPCKRLQIQTHRLCWSSQSVSFLG